MLLLARTFFRFCLFLALFGAGSLLPTFGRFGFCGLTAGRLRFHLFGGLGFFFWYYSRCLVLIVYHNPLTSLFKPTQAALQHGARERERFNVTDHEEP